MKAKRLDFILRINDGAINGTAATISNGASSVAEAEVLPTNEFEGELIDVTKRLESDTLNEPVPRISKLTAFGELTIVWSTQMELPSASLQTHVVALAGVSPYDRSQENRNTTTAYRRFDDTQKSVLLVDAMEVAYEDAYGEVIKLDWTPFELESSTMLIKVGI